MHRVERLLVRIQHKDLAHTSFLVCSCEPPEARVMVASTRFSGGTSARHWLHPLRLFNRAVLALQAGLAPEGRNGNACLENGGSLSSLLSAHAQGLQNNTRPLCKPPHSMRGFMTIPASIL